MKETELKVKYNFSEKEKITHFCLENGFLHIRSVEEQDIYFTLGGLSLGDSDQVLRLRHRRAESELNGIWLIAYKGRNLSMENLQERQELETTIGSGEIAQEILLNIGCREIIRTSKQRAYYNRKNVTIAVDYLENLGHFFEIEILSTKDRSSDNEKIMTLLTSIGLSYYCVEPKTYLELQLEQANL